MTARIPEEKRINQINSNNSLRFISWDGCYKNSYSRAIVECAKDGFRWSVAINSIINTGSGCPECKKESVGNAKRCKKESIIKRINLSKSFNFIGFCGDYKNQYSYAFVSCKNCCRESKVRVNSILHVNSGCPYCCETGFNKDDIGYLYLLRSDCGIHAKVGISNNPERRFKELRRHTPFNFSVIECFMFESGHLAIDMERSVHRRHSSSGFLGFQGATEWLLCTDELLSEMRRMGR